MDAAKYSRPTEVFCEIVFTKDVPVYQAIAEVHVEHGYSIEDLLFRADIKKSFGDKDIVLPCSSNNHRLTVNHVVDGKYLINFSIDHEDDYPLIERGMVFDLLVENVPNAQSQYLCWGRFSELRRATK